MDKLDNSVGNLLNIIKNQNELIKLLVSYIRRQEMQGNVCDVLRELEDLLYYIDEYDFTGLVIIFPEQMPEYFTESEVLSNKFKDFIINNWKKGTVVLGILHDRGELS